MNAEEFAEEFVNDLLKSIENHIEEKFFYFSVPIYNEDPELKILKTALNKVGYDLILIGKRISKNARTNPSDKLLNQRWKLIKI